MQLLEISLTKDDSSYSIRAVTGIVSFIVEQTPLMGTSEEQPLNNGQVLVS